MLKLSNNLELPIAAVTQKFAFLGRTGGGKSYAATKLAEEMLKINAQIVCLDVVGNWYGLRVPKNAKGKAFDILVFGGQNGDIEINPKAGKIVAGIILEKNLSAVIDISEFISSEQMRFAYDFLTAFFEGRKKNPSACHLFVEEAQELVPQNVPPGNKGEESFGAKMLHAGERILKIGRNYGIGASLITQRPQDVNKKVLNQTEVLLAFQMTGLQERETIKKWVAEKGQDEKFTEQLPKLGTGEALIWSPAWLKISGTYKIAEKMTADVSATPEVGATQTKANTLAKVDVEELKGSIQALTAELEANTPAALKKQIGDLEKQLRDAVKNIPQKVAEAAVRVETVTETVEVAVFPHEAAELIDNVCSSLAQLHSDFEAMVNRLASDHNKLREQLTVLKTLPESVERALPSQKSAPKPTGRPAESGRPGRLNSRVAQNSPSNEDAKQAMPIGDAELAGKLSRPQRKILDVLASFEPLGLNSLSKSNLAVFADVSPKSSSFANNLSSLRNNAGTLGAEPLIEYLAGGHVALTSTGRSFADGSGFSASTNEDLRDAWCRKLSGPQGRMLRELFSVYPEAISRSELSDAVEASETSSSFANNLSSLRSLGLIDCGPNKTVFATDLLFPFD